MDVKNITPYQYLTPPASPIYTKKAHLPQLPAIIQRDHDIIRQHFVDSTNYNNLYRTYHNIPEIRIEEASPTQTVYTQTESGKEKTPHCCKIM